MKGEKRIKKWTNLIQTNALFGQLVVCLIEKEKIA